MKEYKETTKENALYNYITMTEKSWTFEKMTKEEQKRLYKVFNDIRTSNALKGTYHQRWEILQAIYHAYLIGIGYTDFNWREIERNI